MLWRRRFAAKGADERDSLEATGKGCMYLPEVRMSQGFDRAYTFVGIISQELR